MKDLLWMKPYYFKCFLSVGFKQSENWSPQALTVLTEKLVNLLNLHYLKG